MSQTSCCTDGCSNTCKEEFQIRNFCLRYYQPRLFVLSQCGHKFLYPVWSILTTVFHVVFFCLDLTIFNWKVNYFAYLTNWAYTLLTFTSIWNLLAVIYTHIRRFDIIEAEYEKMTWYLKILWSLFNIINPVSILISIMYYAHLNDEDNNAGTIAKHVFNSVFTVINICLSAMPVRLLHFYQPMLFALIYLLFNLIYQLGFNNSAIYAFMDWTNLSFTLPAALGLLLLVPVSHLLFYMLYQLRVYIAYKSCNKTSRTIERDVSGRLELQLHF